MPTDSTLMVTTSPAAKEISSGGTIPVPVERIAPTGNDWHLNKYRELIGLTICNDMTSRNIEGENPLYLSQAKIYYGSNALGPMIRPIWEIADHAKLAIDAKIERGANIIWQAQTSLAQLNRSFTVLIAIGVLGLAITFMNPLRKFLDKKASKIASIIVLIGAIAYGFIL